MRVIRKIDMSLAKSTSLNFFSQMLTVLLLALNVIVLTRVLGPAGKGAYSLVIQIPGIILLIGNFGIAYSNVYFLGKGEKTESIIVNSILVAGFGGVIISLGFYVLLPFFQHQIFHDISSFNVLLAICAGPFLLLIYFLSHVLLSRNIIEFNIVSIFQFNSSLFFLPLFLFVLSLNLKGAVLAYVVSIVLTAAISIIFVKRHARIHLNNIDLPLLIRSINFGSRAYLFHLAQALNYRIDLVIVAYYCSLTQVGYYSIAVAIAEVITRIPNSIALALFPILPSLDKEEAGILAAKACRHTLFIVFVGLFGLAFLGRILVVLFFGLRYTPVLAPLWWLFPGMLSISLFKVLLYYVTSEGKPEIGAYVSFISLLVTIALNIVLIPRFGIIGAAITSSISYTVGAVLLLGYFLYFSKNKLSSILFIKRADFVSYRTALVSIFQNPAPGGAPEET